MSLNIVASKQSCGAEITGIDLKKDLSETHISEIRDHWLKYHVLSFPNQALSDDDLERFTLYFGSFGDDFIWPGLNDWLQVNDWKVLHRYPFLSKNYRDSIRIKSGNYFSVRGHI